MGRYRLRQQQSRDEPSPWGFAVRGPWRNFVRLRGRQDDEAGVGLARGTKTPRLLEVTHALHAGNAHSGNRRDQRVIATFVREDNKTRARERYGQSPAQRHHPTQRPTGGAYAGNRPACR